MVVAERSKRIVLCPADNAVMPRCMVHLYYHNADQQPGFMSFALLRDSFYHTLSTSLPLALATDMRMTSQAYGGLTVAAATADSEYPPVTKHTDKQHTIANMMAADFALDTQPPAITSLPAVTNPLQGNALVTLDVVYLTDGVGLGLSFSHAVADMGAVAKFCQEWSQLAQSLYIDSVPMYMPTKLNTDRAWFWSQILNELPATPKSPFDLHLESLNSANHNPAPSPTDPESTLYRIGISPLAVEHVGAIRNQLCAEVSIPSFILALLWRAISHAASNSHYTYLANSLTVRTSPRYSAYWGNTATMKYIYHDTLAICSQPISDTARLVHSNACEFTPAEFGHIIRQYTENPLYIPCLLQFVENQKAPRLMVTNMSRMPYYKANFGFGSPIKALWPPHVPPGLAAFFPQSPNGGIDIYLNASHMVVENIITDNIFKGHITILKYK